MKTMILPASAPVQLRPQKWNSGDGVISRSAGSKYLNRFVLMLTAFFVVLALSPAAFAQKPEIYTKKDNLGARGYDVVSFFTQSEPVKGSEEFTTSVKDATWRFSSQENLDLFTENPEAYMPQYGGYCAWATSQNQLAPGNPKYWAIVDGKLYLNYSRGVQKKWKEDIPGFIELADANWPGVLSEEE